MSAGLARKPRSCGFSPDFGELAPAHEIRDRFDAYFFHHVTTMDLHGFFRDAEVGGDLLVEHTGNHTKRYIPLPWRQGCGKRALIAERIVAQLFVFVRRWPHAPRLSGAPRPRAWSENPVHLVS